LNSVLKFNKILFRNFRSGRPEINRGIDFRKRKTGYQKQSMNYRRAAAAAISLLMIICISGCDIFGIKLAEAEVSELLRLYNIALNDLDADDVRRLTDWTEEDSDYTAIEKMFYAQRSAENEGLYSCTRYIASTITIDYDISTLDINGDRASIEVEYELADWQPLYLDDTYGNCDEILSSLKSSDDTIKIDSKITFEKVDGVWKMCQIHKLGEVMKFAYTTPVIDMNA